MPYENSPGSIIAIADGCTCPMAKNNFGVGLDLDDGWGYVVNENCPIHHHGLKPALNGQLSHTYKPHSLVNPEPSNPHNYVE